MTCKCHGTRESSDGRYDLQYAVKIVCGVVRLSDRPPNPLPPGRYSTATNVHNPSRCDAVTLRWKVAIGLPGLRVGPVSDFADATLGPDEALEIDCSDIVARLERSGIPLPPYVKGWVIIETPAELDVVAVYGTAREAEEHVNAFHTERVEPRCLPVCDDFGFDISTGVAAWEVKGPAAGASFTTATLSQPMLNLWSAPLSGSLWVVPGGQQDEGDYTYRLRFKLCSGFRKPSLNLRLLADYYANVFLNGHHVPPAQTSGPNFNTPVPFVTGSFFKAGDNELTVVVHNSEKSPTGLDLHGFIEAANGLCPGVPYPLLPCPEICYMLHSRTFYWDPFIGMFIDLNQRNEGPGCQWAEVGETTGWRRAEMFAAWLSGAVTPGTSLEYRVFTRNIHGGLIGWSAWTNSWFAGQTGADHPITALEIRLVNAPVNCHVQYQVATRPRLGYYNPSVSWSQWYSDGQTAGSTSGSGWPQQYPPIVAVRVQIV